MEGDTQLDSLLGLNQMAYRKPYPLSVASNVQWRSFRAAQQVIAASGNGYVEISPGSGFIDPSVSYLQFTVTYAGGGAINLSDASATSFLEETVVRSRTGVELSRSQNQNLGRLNQQPYREAFYYGDSIGSTYSRIPQGANGDTFSVSIPLSETNPFFTSDMLIPSMAGMLRLELTMAPAGTALFAAGGDNYQISDLKVVCKVYEVLFLGYFSHVWIARRRRVKTPLIYRVPDRVHKRLIW